MNEFDEFKKLLAWLFALYPNAQYGVAVVDAWWSLLSDYPTALIRHSARRLVKQRTETRYPPTAPELLDYVRSDAKSWGRQPPPERPALPEASLTTTLGGDHPVTLAIASATGADGQIDALQAIRAITRLVG